MSGVVIVTLIYNRHKPINLRIRNQFPTIAIKYIRRAYVIFEIVTDM
jgi:hypothetical protein